MKVVRQSYGKKIGSSFIGAILGIIMFLGSFVVLYLNEGRENLGKVADSVTEISAQGSVTDGALVSVKGNLDADTYAADDYLIGGNYIALSRYVEIYAYVETEHSESHDNLGGSTTTTYTYTYSTEWTSSPESTSSYEGDSSEIPSNIPASYNSWISGMPSSASSDASGLSIGAFNISGTPDFSGAVNLTLSEAVANNDSITNSIVTSNYIIIGNQDNVSSASPKLGDVRISYTVITANDSGVIFGAVNGNTISSYTTPKDNSLFRFFAETDSTAEAVEILKTEHKTMTWLLRLAGFLLMFIGLICISGPITNLLSVVPVFSHISSFVFGIIAFFVSLILTSLTIILSMVLHNFWLAIAFVSLVVIIIVLILKKKKKHSRGRDNDNNRDDSSRYDNNYRDNDNDRRNNRRY